MEGNSENFDPDDPNGWFDPTAESAPDDDAGTRPENTTPVPPLRFIAAIRAFAASQHAAGRQPSVPVPAQRIAGTDS